MKIKSKSVIVFLPGLNSVIRIKNTRYDSTGNNKRARPSNSAVIAAFEDSRSEVSSSVLHALASA